MKQSFNVYRQGKGLPLTLLHGWGMNAVVFEPLVKLLSQVFEIIRVDLPGYGQTQWGEVTDFDSQVDQLANLLPRSCLLGWSMGGLYATTLAKRYPQRFSHLILVSSNPCFVQQADWPCAIERSLFDDLSLALIEDWSTHVNYFVGLQLSGDRQIRQRVRQVTDLLKKESNPHPDALRMGMRLLLSRDARGELSNICQPALAILGGNDKLVPASLALQLELINARIHVKCLPHSTHVPFISHPEIVAGLIREFIESATA